MKTKFFLFGIVMMMLITLLNCKKSSVITTTIDAPAVTTSFVVQFFDAADQTLIGMNSSREIKITVLGKNASEVKDVFGRSVSSVSTHKGIIALTVNHSLTPSAASPVTFVLDINCEGYLHASLPVEIASTGGHSFIVRLVNPLAPPDGVAVFEGIVGRASANGALESEIDASTPPVQQTQATTKIKILAGTIIRDASGAPLSGDLTLQMVYYSNQSPVVLDCFPGSFCVKADNGGILSNGLFFSGGWADYKMTDASGKIAATVSDSMMVTMDVPSNTYNPQTKTLIKAGDYFPIWSYNFSNGTWEFENEGLVQGPKRSGPLCIIYPTIKMPTKRNVDKWINSVIPVYKIIDEIYYTIYGLYIINIRGVYKTSNTSNATLAGASSPLGSIRLIYKEKSTGFIYWSSGYLNASGDRYHIPDQPCDIPTVIEVWGGCPNALLGSQEVNNLCTNDSLGIKLDNYQQPAGTVMDVVVNVTANCEFVRIKPNVSAFYDDGCGWKYIGETVNGKITIPGLEKGKGYSFGAWIDDNWFSDFYIVNEANYSWNIELPQSICSKY